MVNMRVSEINIVIRPQVSGRKEENKGIRVPVHADVTRKTQTKGNKEGRKPLPPPIG
jgi:hypothetical protein